ncbi:MAG: hypothetical protein H6822_00040 [Planctomycetaceae bacterium]|nr:hypothetical protein [Planctomycetaceae bacterium]
MSFDVDRLLEHCRTSIERFAREHPNETFYAFAIDADMLCLNSLEQFAQTLHAYQSNWDRQTRRIDNISDLTEEDLRDEEFGLKIEAECCGLDRTDDQAVLAVINENRARQRAEGCEYRTDEGVRELRDNTGDWAYQGFADLTDDNGFDSELYSDHYYEAGESDDGHAPNTEYAIAMTELTVRLKQSEAFNPLKRTTDFTVSWVDHSY